MYFIDWVMCLFLLMLAILEYPFYEEITKDVAAKLKIVASVIEALLLIYFTFDLGLRFSTGLDPSVI